METIIASCISAFVAIAVCMINSNRTIAVIEVKLEEMSKRLDKHNNFIERIYALERKMEVQEEKMKVANHRIEDLEVFKHE